MHSLRSAAVQYTNYGTGGAFGLPTQSGTYKYKCMSVANLKQKFSCMAQGQLTFLNETFCCKKSKLQMYI